MTYDEFDERAEAAFTADGAEAARGRLASLAAADPGLADRWADLEPALDVLAGARLEPLPDGLHRALIEAARTGIARGQRPARDSWLSFITAAIQVRPAYALGGAVAAGIAIGALGCALILGAAGEGLRGAKGLAPGTTASLPPMPNDGAVTRLDQGGARVELTTRRGVSGFIVHVEAHGADAAVLTLTWDPARLRLADVRWEAPSSSAFESAAGRARLPLQLATGSELTLSQIAPGGSAVRVALSDPAGEQEETLRLPR